MAKTLTDPSPEAAERIAKLKRSPTKRGPAALKSRMLVAGAALGAGLALVGGMSASAQATVIETTTPETTAPASHIVRVVVDAGTEVARALPPATQGPVAQNSAEGQAATPAPPVTESGGS